MISEIKKTFLDSVYEVKILLQIFVIIFFIECYLLYIEDTSILNEKSIEFITLKMIIGFVFFVTITIFSRAIIKLLIIPIFRISPSTPHPYFDKKILRASMALGVLLMALAFKENNFIVAIIGFQRINNLIGFFGAACILFACITEPKEENLLKYTAGDKMGKRDSINANTGV